MRFQFDLTHGPVSIYQVPTIQTLDQALDVSSFDCLDLHLIVPSQAFQSAVPGQMGVVITIVTGMQNQTDDGWVELCSFGSMPGTGSLFYAHRSTHNFLRYIRWNVPC